MTEMIHMIEKQYHHNNKRNNKNLQVYKEE